MRPVRALLVVILLGRPVAAQEVAGNLQGRVVAARQQPVAEAQVTVAGPSLQGTRTSWTDAGGFFQVLGLPAGSYTLRLARIGFRP